MKRILIFNLVIWMAVWCTGQPIINNLYNLDVGDKYWINLIDTEEDVIPVEGTGRSWDYSNITGTLIEGKPGICVNPSNTPFADSTAVKASNKAVMTYDPDDTEAAKIYQYLVADNKRVMVKAIAVTYQDAFNYGHYINPDTFLIFPFTYGNEFESTYEFWGDINRTSPYYYRDVGLKQTKAVGYGTIKTPAGVFENALLVKSEIVSSMFYLDGNPGGQNIRTTEYSWYVPGIKISVMGLLTMEGETGGTLTYVAKTEFAEGGIDNGENGGNGGNGDNGGNGGNGGNGEPDEPVESGLSVFANAGEYYLKSNGSLSWTMGEAVIETLEGSFHFLTQGFGQTEDIITRIDKTEKTDKFLVYPNPFHALLNIQINNFTEPVPGTIYSNTGQVLKNFILNEPVSQLHLNDLKPGMYFIRLIKDKTESFIIYKN